MKAPATMAVKRGNMFKFTHLKGSRNDSIYCLRKNLKTVCFFIGFVEKGLNIRFLLYKNNNKTIKNNVFRALRDISTSEQGWI